MSPLLPRLARTLELEARTAQREWHAPGVSVGVVRDGEPVWSVHVGSARLGADGQGQPADDDTQVMIGSITKTFTALLVMQLRDEGRLSLDDPLGTWLPQSRHAALTVRRLLSHTSGLQREPDGHIWDTLEAPDAAELLDGLDRAERVLPPQLVFHYSNLAFALLGQIVERLDTGPWEQSLQRRVLDPLHLTRTALVPAADRAVGYHVDPYAGTATAEPVLETRATAPLGGLWSSVGDMGRYAAFLADPPPGVLRAETLAEMCRPLVMTDPDGWTGGYGLGLELARSGERVYVGHRGAMPGFLSALRVSRVARTGVFAVANSTAGAAPARLAGRVLDLVLDELPPLTDPWVPEQPRADLAELLGPWWSEGEELVLEVRSAQLWMRVARGTSLDATRFAPEAADRFRAVEGRERGELLELVRDEQGRLVRLYFASYAVTRDPRGFGAPG